MTHRRGRRRAEGRDDHRHRRLGPAAQADGAGPGHPAQRPQGPDDRQLGRRRRRPARPGRQDPQARLRVRQPRLGPAGAATSRRPARRAPSPSSSSSTRACSRPACARPPSGCRSCRCAPASAPTCWSTSRGSRRSPARTTDGEELVAVPALRPRRRARAPQPRRPARQRDVPRPGPVLRRPLLHGRRPGLRLRRAGRRHRRPDRRHPGPAAAAQPDDGRPASSRRRTARTSRPARPTTSATRSSSARTPPRRPAATRTGPRSAPASSRATRRRTKPPSRRSQEEQA